MPPRPLPQRTLTLCGVSALTLLFVSCEPMDLRPQKLEQISPDWQVHPDSASTSEDPLEPTEYRRIDGSGNHAVHPRLGAAGTILRRLLPDAYEDEVSTMAGSGRPSPREISNAVCAQSQPPGNPLGASDFLWQWGQFVDHDISLTTTLGQSAPITVPTGDPFFDPFGTGVEEISFHRSQYHIGTGIDSKYPRQQMNMITHFIDASNVYGSDEARAIALRTNDGTGRLRISANNLLPFNTDGLDNAGGVGPEFFLAGDVRANEQVGLTAMHTLFVREHNRLAQQIAAGDPALSGEEVYLRARRFVGALMQVITYNEFLPALLGPAALAPYDGYDDLVSPSIINVFSTAAYRFGHSALSPNLLRLDAAGNPISFGNLPLRDAFFAPDRIVNEGGIEPILRGLASQEMSRIDTELVDDVRNFLFGPPGSGGFDLASLNIQRGRDHGLPNFSYARYARGMARITSFDEIGSDPDVQARLASVYDSVDDVDPWVGSLAEDPINGGHVGPFLFHIITLQFEALRDGDSYWYELVLTPDEIVEVESTTLADVIRRNTSIGLEISDDVFRVN